jgi:hypothetical protein
VCGCSPAATARDSGPGAVGVDEQQQPLEQDLGVEVVLGAGRGEDVQAAGPPAGLGEHVHQRDHTPSGPHRRLEPAQVPRLGRGIQRGQLDRPRVAPFGDLQPGQSLAAQGVVERRQLGVHLLTQFLDEPLRVQGLAELGVVLRPVGLEGLGQIVVGVAPLLGADHPDLLAPQLLPQGLEHPALVHAAQDPLPGFAVGPVHQLHQLARDDPVDRDLLAERVALDPVGHVGLVPLDQSQGVHHRRGVRASRPPDSPPPVETNDPALSLADDLSV